MANYKSLRLTIPHGIVEDPVGTFTPATEDFQVRNADGSLETLTLTIVGVGGPKDVVVDLGANPCCTKIISGPYTVCPETVDPFVPCTPPTQAPDIVDPTLVL